MDPRLNFENRILRLGVERNVCVVCWRDAPTVLELREMAKAGKRLALEHKKGSALFSVILGGTPSFPEDVREEVGVIVRDDSLFTLAAAHVILVTGLAGAAVRAFLSTAFLLSRPNTPNKVFADIKASAQWAHKQLETGSVIWSEAELVDFVERVVGPIETPEERAAAKAKELEEKKALAAAAKKPAEETKPLEPKKPPEQKKPEQKKPVSAPRSSERKLEKKL